MAASSCADAGVNRVAGRALRVLAAEDSPVNQLMLKTLLLRIGAQLVVVGDGRAAVAAWETGAWDVVLMDIQMPVLDGLEATRKIRAIETAERRDRTPIIGLTADAAPSVLDALQACGMDGFLAKPLEATRLFEALRSAVAPKASPAITAVG
jgi:CheY-like chemotaxis protein